MPGARTVGLAWAVPFAAVLVACCWLLPSVQGPSQFGSLSHDEPGAVFFQVVWIVWSGAIASLASGTARDGRPPGRSWELLQWVLLALAAIRALPLLLVLSSPALARALLDGPVWAATPLLVLLLCAVQGVLILFAA